MNVQRNSEFLTRSAALPLINITKVQVEQVEDLYHESLKYLLKEAVNSNQGLLCQDKIMESAIVKLVNTKDKKELQLNTKEAFFKLLKLLQEHLIYPSYFLVHILIKFNLQEEACQVAFSLQNPVDKSKSFIFIIEALLKNTQVQEAIEMWKNISTKIEKNKASSLIVTYLIKNDKLHQAKKFICQVQDIDQNNYLQRVMAIHFTEKHLYTRTLHIIKNISDPQDKSLIKSRVVQILCDQGNFRNARRMALSIEDPDYKEEAILHIMKGNIKIHHDNEAQHFVEETSKKIQLHYRPLGSNKARYLSAVRVAA